MTFGTQRLSASRTGRLYPQECSWYSFSLGAELTPGPWNGQKEMSLKNPVTPPGIDPRTVRLVVQHLNHYATPGPKWYTTHTKIQYSATSKKTLILNSENANKNCLDWSTNCYTLNCCTYLSHIFHFTSTWIGKISWGYSPINGSRFGQRSQYWNHKAYKIINLWDLLQVSVA